MSNSKRLCTGCKVRYPAEIMNRFPAGYFCSINCATDYASKRSQTTRIREQAKARRELKVRLKTRRQWLTETQQIFNTYIRERDIALPCISCGRHHTGQYHAGHYRPATHEYLRFSTINTHKQCQPCNMHKSGNLIEYRKGLINKIGVERVEWLERTYRRKTWTIDELKKLKKRYRRKLRELKQGREDNPMCGDRWLDNGSPI